MMWKSCVCGTTVVENILILYTILYSAHLFQVPYCCLVQDMLEKENYVKW